MSRGSRSRERSLMLHPQLLSGIALENQLLNESILLASLFPSKHTLATFSGCSLRFS
jgi:hypothetical protein